MKYIRTEDGRILRGSNYGFGVGMPYKNYDVKIADNIEELCDCFVYWFNESDKPIIAIANEMGYVPHAYTIKQIYGAIWTDKGLIYVAKLNEKGEWELL